ncbi:hypothetical protein [Streptomyces sp. NPDC058249]|uniref:hypothetical protein n=1 Tax=unclassified Streptomyces TaxID=2593676 RepID=UPI0036EDAEE0
MHAEVSDVLIVHGDEAVLVSLPTDLARWMDAAQAAEAAVVTEELSDPAALEVSAAGWDEPVQVTVMRDSPRAGVHDGSQSGTNGSIRAHCASVNGTARPTIR